MNWRIFTSQVWTYGMKNRSGLNIEFYIGKVDGDDTAAFIVCPIYNKRYKISKYGVYFQNKEYANAGENFVLHIRNCSTAAEGRRIAETFLEAAKDGGNPKNNGTRYMHDMTFLHGPFFNL